jgi:hypothetical protein
MLYLVPWFECKDSLAVHIHTLKREKESQECARMSRHNWWSTLSFCWIWVSVMKSWTCVMFKQQCQVSWTLNVKRPAWRLYHQLLSACQICNFLSQVVSAQDEEILELYHYNEGCATKFISHVIRKNFLLENKPSKDLDHFSQEWYCRHIGSQIQVSSFISLQKLLFSVRFCDSNKPPALFQTVCQVRAWFKEDQWTKKNWPWKENHKDCCPKLLWSISHSKK